MEITPEYIGVTADPEGMTIRLPPGTRWTLVRGTGRWSPWKPGDDVEGLATVNWCWVAITPPNVVTIARWDDYLGAFTRPHSGEKIQGVYAWVDADRPDPPTREETATWLPS